MQKCDIRAPELEECLVKNGNAAIPELVKGKYLFYLIT